MNESCLHVYIHRYRKEGKPSRAKQSGANPFTDWLCTITRIFCLGMFLSNWLCLDFIKESMKNLSRGIVVMKTSGTTGAARNYETVRSRDLSPSSFKFTWADLTTKSQADQARVD